MAVELTATKRKLGWLGMLKTFARIINKLCLKAKNFNTTQLNSDEIFNKTQSKLIASSEHSSSKNCSYKHITSRGGWRVGEIFRSSKPFIAQIIFDNPTINSMLVFHSNGWSLATDDPSVCVD